MPTLIQTTRLPIFGAALVVAGLVLGGALPAAAQTTTPASCDAPVLDLANPSPGDMLSAGGYMIQGTAFDPRSMPDNGIDKVSIFLDPRDEGGMDLGQGMPGVNGFNVEVTIPKGLNGEHNLVAYAHSSLTGHETAVTVPVILNEDPSKAGIVAGTVTTESNTNPGANPGTCGGATSTTTTITTTPAVAPAATPMAVTAPVPVAAMATNPATVQLGNPSAGDSLIPGGYVVMGSAWDSRAQQGSGIDKISFFLDPRDSGGIPLGEITLAQPGQPQFTATLQLPANHASSHLLTAYAHSTVSDTENSTSVPITMEH